MKRALVPGVLVLLLTLSSCTAQANEARPAPTVTVTETVRVPAPDYTPQDDASVAADEGVSEFAVGFVSSYKRETGATIDPKDAQARIDAVCAELASGTNPDSVTALPEADQVVREVFAQAIQKNAC